MTRQEQLERRRYRSILWFLVGFGTWQGVRVAQGLWPALNAWPLDPVATGISLTAWMVWLYQLVRLSLLKRRLSDTERRQLNDERVRRSRRKSFGVGFWAMIAATGPILFLPGAFTATTVANLMILVGGGAGLCAFLYFETNGVLPFFNDGPAAVFPE
jgi:hypothetical protein